ncbi:Gfo/Idh/MocA family protein [Glaesserella parasuis]|nr:Gfo/Idh/MocA family oxidoreductase [Glaesserella parasuis]AIK18317.1 oxidoreductase [Glaesserella parasuis]AMW17681.1 oxidoreductase [Glaesserella parasuis]MDD2164847.1 Gfo/Idh/MocA family oxidoreductase [Glaesserella parasuis]MDD2165920.1 Gfo/Idh/MocA family oxidoreductase [Glaesserella parasuis]MDD2175758.1 Gfo/Idh/MocA family oxidoreductase [Glaesserella parasuis]
MYNVGVIGLGLIAYGIDKDPNRKIIWSHIKAYKSIENIRISSVCDVKKSLVDSIQKECDIPNGYTDYKEMLKSNKFDIVSICTPIQTHFDIIKECIKNGVKVIFCEKTISYSLEESKEIVELCDKHNVIIAVNYIFRWDNLIQEIKGLLDSNAIGNIYSLVGYGATALHTSTSHLIDLLLYFSGSDIEYVVGDIQKDFVRNVHGISDVGGTGMIKFKSNSIGFIKGTSSSPMKYMFELDILGENGRIRLYNNGSSYDLYKFSSSENSSGSKYEHLDLVYSKHNTTPNERMIDAILSLIEGIETGKQPVSNIKTAIESIEVIESIKLSSMNGNIIKFQ